MRVELVLVGAFAAGVIAGACVPSGSGGAGSSAEPGAPAGSAAHGELALATARKDLGCPAVEVVMELDRRFLNGNMLRFVIEGCGVRATYAESCYLPSDPPKGSGYTEIQAEQPGLKCKDVLISKVPLLGAGPSGSGSSASGPSGVVSGSQ